MTNNTTLECLNIHSSLYQTRISNKFKNRKPFRIPDPKKILGFIPGTILDVYVKEGDNIKKGDILLILDAMKMKNRLKCNVDGTVKSVFVKSGDRVAKGTVLLELE